MTSFQKWLTTFTEEKKLDLSEYVKAGDGSFIQVGDVLSAAMDAPKWEQTHIKKILVMIDFKNGNPLHFIEHLALALDKSYSDNRLN